MPDDSPRRAMGVDYGERRIGLALSDPLGVTAQPFAVVERVGPRKDANVIGDHFEEQSVDVLVVGLPLTLSGEAGPAVDAVRQFVERVQRRLPGKRIVFWDERMTTVQAEREMITTGARREKRRQRIDSVAATLILQSWLDAES
ncbi:MAG: Holliday junction resolvase RuvX [Acidobacteriota bacterium]|nr:Holliday junction resolvase RuvX [Acidobacteriota bacterium]MDH3784625.1 Holliday junction resolvase RuvX [Acidobacteriota bacterium]